jgi:pyridoxamine 5'-phosphate oxidase
MRQPIYVYVMAEAQAPDPIAQFLDWFEVAKQRDNFEPTACAVATANASGEPSVRMVLLKEADERGFVFYTNTESKKGEDLGANPFAALLFHWQKPHRQIRVEGPVSPVSDDEADAYFATRHRTSQIGAWASAQTRPMTGRFNLERLVAEHTAKLGIAAVPRPPHWSGYRITPKRIEFWEERKFRLHDRISYERHGENWRSQRLFP